MIDANFCVLNQKIQIILLSFMVLFVATDYNGSDEV